MKKPSPTPSGPITQVETFTPQSAADILEHHNNRNRPFIKSVVESYVGMLQRGQFLTATNDMIAFDWNGELLNGQHRLKAIVESGIQADAMTIRGLDPKTQDVMDQGARRNYAQILYIRTGHHSTEFAAMTRLLWIHKTTGNFKAVRVGPTIMQLDEIRDELDLNKADEAIKVGRRYIGSVSGSLPKSILAACWLLMDEADPAENGPFWDQLITGANLPLRSPQLALTKFVNTLAVAGGQGRGSGINETLAAVLFKAFNEARTGQQRDIMSYKLGTEKFPKLLTAHQVATLQYTRRKQP